jgi:hypothetical protein
MYPSLYIHANYNKFVTGENFEEDIRTSISASGLEDRTNQGTRELHKTLKLVADVEKGDGWSGWGM